MFWWYTSWATALSFIHSFVVFIRHPTERRWNYNTVHAQYNTRYIEFTSKRLYSSRVMKLQSVKCPWCAGNCLLWVRCLGWYCFDAVDCGRSSWCSVWSGLFIILLNSWSSHFSSSSPNSGMSAGQKPHRLLRRIIIIIIYEIHTKQ